MPSNDKEQNNSPSRQEEDLGSKVNKDGRIREGPRRKGGVNDEPKTPRPNARPQPWNPSASSSDASDGSGGGESSE